MKFTKTEPSIDFDIFRLLSETGKWEIGVRRMLFGIKVCGNPVWDDGYTFDYCAGNDGIFALHLLVTITQILERYPEDVKREQISRDFPKYEIKPINKDPYCWKRLQEMAEGDCS